MLVWRSPNQVGEYVVLKPTEQSHDLPWATADGRKLPPRVDLTETEVDPETAGGLGEGQGYTV